MKLYRGLALLAFTLTALAGPRLADAATATCMSSTGSCEVSNDGFDWVDCMCDDGSGGGGGGGNTWAGLSEMELQPICEEQLTAFCGPFIPPDYLQCFGLLGECIIDNEPEDSIECSCYDGTSGGFAGGMAWAGYSDMQLVTECETQLDMFCLPPPGSQTCSNANGECTISNMPSDFLACECNDGSGGALGGGNAWAGYSELQLDAECGSQLVGLCGGPLPPPLWVECSSGLGDCIIDNDPVSLLECTCSNGDMFSGDPGKDFSGLDQAGLLMECEDQLYEGCFVEAGTDTGDTGDTEGPGSTGDTGDTGDTEGPGSTGEPGTDTGLDTEGPSEDSTGGTPPPATTGDDSSGGASEDDGGAVDGDDGGCTCSADSGSNPSGWGLLLLGLVGVVRRRRRGTPSARGLDRR